MLTDHLGSVVAITDSSGTLITQQRYLPFGQIRQLPNYSTAQLTDYGYTGQRSLDSGMGEIMDYKARFYSPVLGRFIQPDSIVPGAGNPQNFNRYSYVANNPVNFADPSGHKPCWAGKYSCGLNQSIADREYAKYKAQDQEAVKNFFANHGFTVGGQAASAGSSGASGGGATYGGMSVELSGQSCQVVTALSCPAPSQLQSPLPSVLQSKIFTPTTAWRKLLANPETPVATASIQLYSGLALVGLLPYVAAPPAAIAYLGVFWIGRGAGIIGFLSTQYQYDNNLYGTNGTDMWVATAVMVIPFTPFIPPPVTSMIAGEGGVLYSGYRLDNQIFNIPWVQPRTPNP